MPDYVNTNRDRLIEVTPALDTVAYAQNDVLFVATVVPNAVPVKANAIITSIRVVDKAKNNAALQLWFLDSSVSIGTINAGEGAADSISGNVLTVVDFAATDYTSEANWSRATKNLTDIGMGAMLKPSRTENADANTELYIAGKITDATGKTYAASDIVIKIGLMVS